MKKTLFAFVIGAVMLSLIPSSAYATTNSVSDDFQNNVKKPDLSLPWDLWYVILDSADSHGFLRLENLQNPVRSNNAVSLTKESDGSIKYARMTMRPQQYPGFFNTVQLSDQRDGFTYNAQHRWLPTVNHPITMRTRLRASSNYNADGSGGAIGTFGTWLQNNPNELSAAAQANPERIDEFTSHNDNFFAIGFNWTDPVALNGYFKGFKTMVIDKYSTALTTTDLPTVNLHDWVNTKAVWSVNEAGVQTVTFFINDQQVASNVLDIPMPALSIATWIDDEQPQFDANGGIIFNYGNPTAQQNVDIDSISVTQN